jgi:hypothetical protein
MSVLAATQQEYYHGTGQQTEDEILSEFFKFVCVYQKKKC